jgi:hypothetical protein
LESGLWLRFEPETPLDTEKADALAGFATGDFAMRERFVYAALVLVVFGAIYLVTQGLNLINQPSDLKVAGGVGLIVVVIVLFPAAMKWIWHHKTTPHNQPNR